jgi:anthranilate/para-aminobenzoate synthase component I
VARSAARFWSPTGSEVLTDPVERLDGAPADLPAVLARVEATPGSWAGWVAADGRSRFTRYAGKGPGGRALPLPEAPPAGPVKVLASLDRAGYLAALERVLAAIGRGDCYQVNLCLRFELDGVTVPAATLWHGLVERLRPPFAALIDDDDHQVACLSPERFLELRGRAVLTSPIKGTRPRGADGAADRALAAELAADPKELAENVMIVDLLRNDLGRVAVPGSVAVPSLFEVQTFPHLHHLVSSVSAELAVGAGLPELFAATFPPGSVTGAPKLAALAQIAALEPAPRGVSMGAVGRVESTGDPATLAARFAVAIRTVELDRRAGTAWFCAGAGIVADSRPAAEYAEVELKAAALLAALGA